MTDDDILPVALTNASTLLDYWTPLLARLCIEEGVFDAYGTTWRRDDDVARALGVNPGVLGRMVRALSSRDVFEENADGDHRLTELGQAFLSAHGFPKGVAGFKPWDLHAWAEARHTLLTGEAAFRHHYGTDYFTWMSGHDEIFAEFSEDMKLRTLGLLASGISAYPWPSAGTVVDVGGGSGYLLSAVLGERPDLKGILFDLPAALADAEGYYDGCGLSDRVTITPGDFFDGVPAGAEIYVMASVLHDWSDDDATRILGTCRKAMTPSSALVVYETVLGEGPTSPLSFGLDVHLAVLLKGRERTRSEWNALFRSADLRLTQVINTPGLSWMEVVPGEGEGPPSRASSHAVTRRRG
ncbi:MAG: hypothetical protein QG622_2759 [Actinomycetota bacterium]|nr:hypothetical protein [Actinomycetota bacterium]